MPKEITDPAVLRELNAPQAPATPTGPKEIRDPDLGTERQPTPMVMGAPDPVRKNIEPFARGVAQSGAELLNTNLRIGDLANQYGPRALRYFPGFPQAGLAAIVPQDFRDKIKAFADEPVEGAQQKGYWAGELVQMFAGGGGVAAGGAKLGSKALEFAAKEGFWQLALHGAASMKTMGLHIPVWWLYKAMREGSKTMMKEAPKGVEKGLEGAKGAGTFIPKTVEGGKGVKAAKTQSNFTEAAKPTAAETAASSQKAARNILQRTSKKGDVSSGDIAAAKLAKMTGAVHPGEEEVVEEFARMPVK
jgi:hypothetical protein